VMGQQLPEGRYGSRARRQPQRWVRWTLGAAAAVAALLAAIAGFNNLGNTPIQGKQTAFRVLDDHSVQVTVEVLRDEPQRPAECVVRARAEAGDEVGRKEIFISPASGTTRQDTIVRTSSRAVIGEVYGCSYNVPAYLSTTARPSG
jgi:hypothetical protein